MDTVIVENIYFIVLLSDIKKIMAYYRKNEPDCGGACFGICFILVIIFYIFAPGGIFGPLVGFSTCLMWLYVRPYIQKVQKKWTISSFVVLLISFVVAYLANLFAALPDIGIAWEIESTVLEWFGGKRLLRSNGDELGIGLCIYGYIVTTALFVLSGSALNRAIIEEQKELGKRREEESQTKLQEKLARIQDGTESIFGPNPVSQVLNEERKTMKKKSTKKSSAKKNSKKRKSVSNKEKYPLKISYSDDEFSEADAYVRKLKQQEEIDSVAKPYNKTTEKRRIDDSTEIENNSVRVEVEYNPNKTIKYTYGIDSKSKPSGKMVRQTGRSDNNEQTDKINSNPNVKPKIDIDSQAKQHETINVDTITDDTNCTCLENIDMDTYNDLLTKSNDDRKMKAAIYRERNKEEQRQKDINMVNQLMNSSEAPSKPMNLDDSVDNKINLQHKVNKEVGINIDADVFLEGLKCIELNSDNIDIISDDDLLIKANKKTEFVEGNSFIYVIQNSITKSVKIGYANNPYNRCLQLQTCNEHRLNLLGCVKGDIKKEKQIHKYFNKYNIMNEWFEFNTSINDFISNMNLFCPTVKSEGKPHDIPMEFDVSKLELFSCEEPSQKTKVQFDSKDDIKIGFDKVKTRKRKFIYVIQNTVTKSVKIGFATNPYVRWSQLQTGNESVLFLLGCIDGNMKKEARIQNAFSEYKINGEWFHCKNEVKDFILKVNLFYPAIK